MGEYGRVVGETSGAGGGRGGGGGDLGGDIMNAITGAFDQVTVSRGIGHLVSLGFVTRQQGANDRRYAVLNLTPAGREAHDRIADLALTAEDKLHAVLSAEERDQLAGMLDRLEGASAEIETAGWRDLASSRSPKE